jgi:hypothetical protein
MNTDSHFDVKSERPAPSQDRSRRTAERFVDAGFKLLESKTFEELSVADLAREADFAQLLASAQDDGVIEAMLADNFASIMHNRNLWHAALRKSAQDPTFWAQFHRFVQRRPQLMAARLGELRGQPLSEAEVRSLGVAQQVFNSVINNQMMNNPGPLTLASPDFLPTLLQVFRAVYASGL